MNRGEYLFTVTLTKVRYASTFGTDKYVRTIKLRLDDPCLSTRLLPTFASQSLYSIVGKQEKSFTYLNYPDSESQKYDEPTHTDRGLMLCGQRSHNLTEVITDPSDQSKRYEQTGVGTKYNYVRLANVAKTNSKEVFYQTDDPSLAGTHLVEVQV